MPGPRRPRALRALSVPTVNRVRRELRNDLARRGYEPGPLEQVAAQAVLHEAVEFYVARLQEKVSRLLRFDAIGELMAPYELFLGETAHSQGALPAPLPNT